MDQQRYDAVLDVYALLATYPAEASSLAVFTQHAALGYLKSAKQKRYLVLLLQLGRDLGYVEADLYETYTEFLH
jgi:hypothetical protein